MVAVQFEEICKDKTYPPIGYMVFNKKNQREASKGMPDNVDCMTRAAFALKLLKNHGYQIRDIHMNEWEFSNFVKISMSSASKATYL